MVSSVLMLSVLTTLGVPFHGTGATAAALIPRACGASHGPGCRTLPPGPGRSAACIAMCAFGSNGSRGNPDSARGGNAPAKAPVPQNTSRITVPVALELALRALGAGIGIAMLCYIEQCTGERFFAPPYASAAILLFGAPELPQLRTIATGTALALISAQLVAFASLPVWLERGVTCCVAMGSMLAANHALYSHPALYPPCAALGMLYLDSARGGLPSVRALVFPAISGHAVLVPFAFAWMRLVQAARRRYMGGSLASA